MQEWRRSARRRHPTRAGFDSPLPALHGRWNGSADGGRALAGKTSSIDDPGRRGRCRRVIDPWLLWPGPFQAGGCHISKWHFRESPITPEFAGEAFLCEKYIPK